MRCGVTMNRSWPLTDAAETRFISKRLPVRCHWAGSPRVGPYRPPQEGMPPQLLHLIIYILYNLWVWKSLQSAGQGIIWARQ